MSVLIAALLCLALGTRSGLPQDYPGKAFRVWQTQDGLPENTVQAFAQTPDGYLWVGMSGGLARFDGEHFQIFDSSNTPAFQENGVLCLMAAKDGSLWIGTDGGGLIRLRNGVFRRFFTHDGLGESFVRALLEDRQGRLWVGTDMGLYRVQGDFLQPDKEFGSTAVQTMVEDQKERIWVGGTGLLMMENGQLIQPPPDAALVDGHLKAALVAHDGTLWVASTSGLSHRTAGAKTFQPIAGLKGSVRMMLETNDHTIWIATVGDGVFLLRDGRLSRLEVSTSVPTNSVLALLQDSNGSI